MLKIRQRGNGLLWVFIILVVLAGGALGYWYYFPSERPWWINAFFPGLPAQQTEVMYKWKDASGRVQYSNTPPPQGTNYETVEYWENANVIPSGSSD